MRKKKPQRFSLYYNRHSGVDWCLVFGGRNHLTNCVQFYNWTGEAPLPNPAKTPSAVVCGTGRIYYKRAVTVIVSAAYENHTSVRA